MTSLNLGYTVVETKICEDCGVNFMRETGSDLRYCPAHRWLEVREPIPAEPVTPAGAWAKLGPALQAIKL